MTRHGKNCTAGAVYTYHEKKKDTGRLCAVLSAGERKYETYATVSDCQYVPGGFQLSACSCILLGDNTVFGKGEEIVH